MVWEGYCRFRSDGMWELTPRWLFQFLEYELNQATTQESWIHEAARFLYRDINKSPDRISIELGVPEDFVRRLRPDILGKFIQPVWFVDLLRGGLVSSTPESLIHTVIVWNTWAARQVNTDVSDAVKIWIVDAIHPARLEEKERCQKVNQFYVRLSDRIVTARLAQMFHHTH